MKKPTYNPKKKKPIAINSLIVDYGLKSTIMPYRVSLEKFYEKEITSLLSWCEKMLVQDTFYLSSGWPGYMYFLHEEDAFIFTLQWTK